MRTSTISIEIVNHPTSAAHKLVKVITRSQRVYAATWAAPFPTPEEVRQVWKEERRVFRPFDETTGRYLGGRKR